MFSIGSRSSFLFYVDSLGATDLLETPSNFCSLGLGLQTFLVWNKERLVRTPVVPLLSFWLSSCESCHLHHWVITKDFASYLLSLYLDNASLEASL